MGYLRLRFLWDDTYGRDHSCSEVCLLMIPIILNAVMYSLASIWMEKSILSSATSGDVQQVFLIRQDDICPLDALRNLASFVPAGPNGPLFSRRDSQGDVRPMPKPRAMECINQVLSAWGWGTPFVPPSASVEHLSISHRKSARR